MVNYPVELKVCNTYLRVSALSRAWPYRTLSRLLAQQTLTSHWKISGWNWQWLICYSKAFLVGLLMLPVIFCMAPDACRRTRWMRSRRQDLDRSDRLGFFSYLDQISPPHLASHLAPFRILRSSNDEQITPRVWIQLANVVFALMLKQLFNFFKTLPPLRFSS